MVRHKKEEAFRLLFLMLYSFRLRMLLGFRSLIANNDELRRIKEEFFQKAASSAVSLCPVSCECMLRGSSAVVPMFAPSPQGALKTFPIMRSHRVTTRFICEIVFSSIPTIVVFPILTLRRWFRGRRFYLAGSGHVRGFSAPTDVWMCANGISQKHACTLFERYNDQAETTVEVSTHIKEVLADGISRKT